jgi:hypothetical protein
MKSAIIFGLLSASVSGMAIEKRQRSPVSDIFSKSLQAQKAFKIETTDSKVYPGAKQMKILHGPYKINPADKKEFQSTGPSMDPHGTGYMMSMDTDFPRDITILRATSYAVDENFQKTDTADGLYNHHDVFFDMGKPATKYISCGGSSTPSSPANILMVCLPFLKHDSFR